MAKRFERRRYTSKPIPWTDKQSSLLLEYLVSNDFDINQVKIMFPNRTEASIRSKTRKLRIKNDLFGHSYRDQKTDFTIKCGEITKPAIVFDAYAGAGHQTMAWSQYARTVYASDNLSGKLEQFSANALDCDFEILQTKQEWTHFKSADDKELLFYAGDALRAAIEISYAKIPVDVLDLDTCGSTLPLLPTLLALLKPKYLVITHGEFHSIRFGRDDVLRRVLFSRDFRDTSIGLSNEEVKEELDKTVKLSALRCHNETKDSLWAELLDEVWLGGKGKGLLRRLYKLNRPIATADSLNEIL